MLTTKLTARQKEKTLISQATTTKKHSLNGKKTAASVQRLVIPRIVSVLCAAKTSHYHDMEGVEVYDANRDARTFQGDTPIVGHPPCRTWSAFTAHQAKPEPGERELGLWVCGQLRTCGGVIEQPAHTRLFAAARFPLPGDAPIDGVWSMAVQQWWWGFRTRKATWLAFCGVMIDQLPDVPYRLHDGRSDRRTLALASTRQRSETVKPFAEWLVAAARLAG